MRNRNETENTFPNRVHAYLVTVYHETQGETLHVEICPASPFRLKAINLPGVEKCHSRRNADMTFYIELFVSFYCDPYYSALSSLVPLCPCMRREQRKGLEREVVLVLHPNNKVRPLKP